MIKGPEHIEINRAIVLHQDAAMPGLHVLVSIVVPVFNRAHLVGETIESVLAQTYAHWELLLVDDGSTDDSFAVCARYAASDPRIRTLKRNRGPKNANTCRNIGAAEANGEFLMFLDSDDLLVQNCLEVRVGNATGQSIDFFLYYSHEFNNGEVIVRKQQPPLHPTTIHNYFLQGRWPYNTPSLFIRKNSFRKVGGFDEELARMQDPDLYLRLLDKNAALKYKAFLICDTLVRQTPPEAHKQPALFLPMMFFAFAQFVGKHLNRYRDMPEEHRLFLFTVHSFFDKLVNHVKPAQLLRRPFWPVWRQVARWPLPPEQKARILFILLAFALVPFAPGYRLALWCNQKLISSLHDASAA